MRDSNECKLCKRISLSQPANRRPLAGRCFGDRRDPRGEGREGADCVWKRR